jgi:two-component sensor histidine kinase
VLKTDIESELLPTDQAIPMGLIVNELVTNALKYAFPSETKGTVMVTLKRVPGELRLTVADDGKGIDIRRADSGLGGRLVEGFAQQLGGQVERESGSQGTTVRLILPSREDLRRWPSERSPTLDQGQRRFDMHCTGNGSAEIVTTCARHQIPCDDPSQLQNA